MPGSLTNMQEAQACKQLHREHNAFNDPAKPHKCCKQGSCLQHIAIHAQCSVLQMSTDDNLSLSRELHFACDDVR